MQKIKPKLKFSNKKTGSIRKLLEKKLIAYNTSQIKNYKHNPVAFSYYDNKKLIAGLFAYQFLGKFFIDLLWVDDSYRHQGLGTKLLKAAEKYATKNKALYTRVNSGSFQAPEFYLKNNYEQFAKLPLITTDKKTHYDYYFVKYLNL